MKYILTPEQLSELAKSGDAQGAKTQACVLFESNDFLWSSHENGEGSFLIVAGGVALFNLSKDGLGRVTVKEGTIKSLDGRRFENIAMLKNSIVNCGIRGELS